MAEVISVSALNQYVKTLLDANDILFDLALRGEIANFVQNSRSGHCYFSLRDEASSVKAVMFRSDARRLGFRPEEGMKVIVRCRATLYERDGAFQVYVNDMFPDGIGSAQLAFEQLKAKLEQEGLFAPEHKKPLPAYPKCIGIVTSKTGAALQDIRNIVSRRWPAVRLLLDLLCNLVQNAAKASPAGMPVTVLLADAGDTVALTVQDHGCGIPADKLARVTEPFYMVDKSRARKQGGSGMGLALCQRIAAVHGGTLQISSQVGVGTAVTVTLPKEVQP